MPAAAVTTEQSATAARTLLAASAWGAAFAGGEVDVVAADPNADPDGPSCR